MAERGKANDGVSAERPSAGRNFSLAFPYRIKAELCSAKNKREMCVDLSLVNESITPNQEIVFAPGIVLGAVDSPVLKSGTTPEQAPPVPNGQGGWIVQIDYDLSVTLLDEQRQEILILGEVTPKWAVGALVLSIAPEGTHPPG